MSLERAFTFALFSPCEECVFVFVFVACASTFENVPSLGAVFTRRLQASAIQDEEGFDALQSVWRTRSADLSSPTRILACPAKQHQGKLPKIIAGTSENERAYLLGPTSSTVAKTGK